MAVAAVVCTLFQTIQALVADRAAVADQMALLQMAGQHLRLARAMLAVLVSAINPEMPEFLVAAAAQVPRVPVVTMLRQFLATVELAFCGPTDTITLAVVVVAIGQQLSVPAMVDWAVVVVVVCRELVQPAPVEVLRLIAAQLVQEILLVQAILPVVPQVPILVEVVVVLAKVSTQVTPVLAVVVDRAPWLFVTQTHMMPQSLQQVAQLLLWPVDLDYIDGPRPDR
jgi:hypothetical protein